MNHPKILYIAGPYRPTGWWRLPILRTIKIAMNIWHARQAAKVVWKTGDIAICPHLNTAFFDGLVPDHRFLEGDLAIMRRCDGILILEGHEKSEGASIEVEEAQKIPGFDIYYLNDRANAYYSFSEGYRVEKGR